MIARMATGEPAATQTVIGADVKNVAAIAAIAGWLFACVQMVVAPEYAGFVFGTELLMWVALGGRGTLIGPVLGTLVLPARSGNLSQVQHGA